MATLPVTLLNGTTADANDVMDDFNEIYDNIDQTNIGASNKTGSGKIVLQTSPTITTPTLSGAVSGTYSLTNPAISGTVDMSAGTVAVTLNAATNALNIDSNTLVIDALNNRVGINTNAPAKKFQINANSSNEELIRLVAQTTTETIRQIFRNSDSTRAFTLDSDFTGSAEKFFIRSDSTTCVTVTRAGEFGLTAIDPPTANFANSNSFVRAWARIKSDGTILASYNVSSISHGSTGSYTINWNTPFSTANYAVIAIVDDSTSGAYVATSRTLATGSCNIHTWNPSGIVTNTDFQIIAIGIQ